MKAGLRRDLWTAMSPDISRMRPIIDKGDKAFAAIDGKVPPKTQAIFLGQAINGLVQRYRTQPPPASFRMISSPLVAWIWIGGLVVFTGGLIALWPSGDPARGRVRGRYAARVARELGRA
jgi:cytochrome c-type biogenesis protein CcmF